MRYLLLLATVLAMAAGQVLFKLAATQSAGRWAFLLNPWFVTALALYVGATLLWMFTLQLWPISTAYPATAVSVVLVVVCGIFMFGEMPSPQQFAGIVIICAGLITLMFG